MKVTVIKWGATELGYPYRNYEWCIGCTSDRCGECTMDEGGFCEGELQDLVLGLINRQKSEIERLKGSVVVNNIMESRRIRREAKAEAYKEFAERLKERIRLDDDCDYNCRDCCYECNDYVIAIDNLLKEMVGEEE